MKSFFSDYWPIVEAGSLTANVLYLNCYFNPRKYFDPILMKISACYMPYIMYVTILFFNVVFWLKIRFVTQNVLVLIDMTFTLIAFMLR